MYWLIIILKIFFKTIFEVVKKWVFVSEIQFGVKWRRNSKGLTLCLVVIQPQIQFWWRNEGRKQEGTCGLCCSTQCKFFEFLILLVIFSHLEISHMLNGTTPEIQYRGPKLLQNWKLEKLTLTLWSSGVGFLNLANWMKTSFFGQVLAAPKVKVIR